MKIEISRTDIERTLTILQERGRDGTECVVMWLGRPVNRRIRIQEVYRPVQETKSDMFWITEKGMDELKACLRRTHTMVAAQVHTHPDQAFHSDADDRWAIVRHQGAISIVLPTFALRTSTLNFERDARAYRLDHRNEWQEIGSDHLMDYLCLY